MFLVNSLNRLTVRIVFAILQHDVEQRGCGAVGVAHWSPKPGRKSREFESLHLCQRKE